VTSKKAKLAPHTSKLENLPLEIRHHIYSYLLPLAPQSNTKHITAIDYIFAKDNTKAGSSNLSIDTLTRLGP